MSRPVVKVITGGPAALDVYRRAVDIAGRLASSEDDNPAVEYSALFAAGAVGFAIAKGMRPSQSNVRRVVVAVAERLVPALDEGFRIEEARAEGGNV